MSKMQLQNNYFQKLLHKNSLNCPHLGRKTFVFFPVFQ